ncbi:hypothetical protein QJS83_04810 [Bdellovibrio sp. 22V]|uniref:hypothetical protein n=1 Tax=Bdellovibrio TaxID=958 RepID=UPI002543CDBB|nr:hypothetical protein [Bdellovibrio sp. 22V]WII73192.1 hypothetical protein QJS83_04810 [Bdellovibrio sp. 22V]
MKKILFSVAFFASAIAFAEAPAHVELCALEIYEEQEVQFTTKELFDIKTAKSISPFFLSLLNHYYGGEPKTFAEFKALYGEHGDESYNDLIIYELTSNTTGRVYLEVKSWPGDNPVGFVHDPKTGEVLASNGDDSYTLFYGNNQEFSCYELNKDKY